MYDSEKSPFFTPSIDPDSPFARAFAKTMGHEGGYVSDPEDAGGETYRGISRVYNPTWQGWRVIDMWKEKNISTEERDIYLKDMVPAFYRAMYWDRFQGDRIASLAKEVAYELFDSAVNMGVHQAVKFLQVALNMQNRQGTTYPDIEVDGKMGPLTISTLQRYLTWQPGNRTENERILLNCMNGEQYIFYKNNPQHERFRGWFSRV